MDEQGKKGTTTVGIITKEGIVLAADKRASMGYLVADKNAEKIHLINDNTVMTFAGSVADSQMLLRYLKSQLALYKIKREKEASVNSIATLLSHYIFSNAHSFSPFMIQFIIGGVDESGFHMFSLDMLGSKMEADTFTSTGSGSPIAYGVLEDNYKKDLTIEEALKLAVRAVNAAIKRDLATGNGIDVVVIDKKGATRVEKKKIESLMS
ncbi:MAG: archaeal proteasome endopeptidase complex subunit beta [Nanoarchaeota archaeon]|nr:archaeal proteasome endopeptidase complex subunit beta [Nanoarchaeota archaeon]